MNNINSETKDTPVLTTQETERAKAISNILDELKAFCDDAILEGMIEGFDNDFDFIESALEVFRSAKE